MPESCFLCLDSTEYMRNGDYYPNRMFSMLEAVNLLVSAKMQLNAENTVGFLTAGGNACTVFETLTMDVDRVLSSLANVKIKGKVCHFSAALRIAALALTHRTNPRSEKRIVIFVGSPIRETEKELETLAKKLRKDDVAVDVVSFGVPENVDLLSGFVSKVNKQENSFFINIEEGSNLIGVLMDTRVFTGPDVIPTGDAAGMAMPGGAGMGFTVDPNADPDLQMALRLSMEEEWQRQAAAAAATGGAAPDGPAGAGSTAPAAPSQSAPPSSATSAPSPTNVAEMVMSSYEEELRRAIELSLQEAAAAAAAQQQQQQPSSTAESSPEPQPQGQTSGGDAGPEDDDEEDEEFLLQLQQALEQSKKQPDNKGNEE